MGTFGDEERKILSFMIEESTTAISDKFAERMLIYKNKFKRTEKGSITLGCQCAQGYLYGKSAPTEEFLKN